MYKIGNKLCSPGDPALDQILENAYTEKVRPLCMCKGEPGIPMYIAHLTENNRYLIKRMPSTGDVHGERCGSWEVSDGISGRGDILGNGYARENDRVFLKLDFALTKFGSRDSAAASATDKAEKLSVNGDTKRMSLQAFLHSLWEDAGLTRRRPGEAAPNWSFVHDRLMIAIDNKVVKHQTLAERVYIPDQDQEDNVAEHRLQRRQFFARIAAESSGSKVNLLVIIAEMKGSLAPATTGDYSAEFENVPDIHFGVSESLAKAFEKNYRRDQTLVQSDTTMHQIVVATVAPALEGTATLEEICYMPVNQNWLPADNVYEEALYKTLDAAGRIYERPLRYNRRRHSFMPAATLMDAGDSPVVLAIVPPSKQLEEIEAKVSSIEFEKWFWDTNAMDEPPELPEQQLPAEGGMSGSEAETQTIASNTVPQ